jgi:hypothetical protein
LQWNPGKRRLSSMAKKKPQSGKKDQHRSPHLVRLDLDVFAVLKAMAQKGNRPMKWEVRQALIAWAKAAGEWPPEASA